MDGISLDKTKAAYRSNNSRLGVVLTVNYWLLIQADETIGCLYFHNLFRVY